MKKRFLAVLVFLGFVSQAQNLYNPLRTPTHIDKQTTQITGKTKRLQDIGNKMFTTT